MAEKRAVQNNGAAGAAPAIDASLDALFPQVPEPSVQRLHFFKEAKPLTLDTRRVAIRLDADQARRLADELEALTGEAASLEPTGAPDWYFAPTGDAIANLQRSGNTPWQATARFLAAAQGRSGSAFASPVFVDDLGGALYFDARLMVGITRQTNGQSATEIITQLIPDAEVAFTNEERTDLQVTFPAKDGFELLEIAEFALQHPEIVYAEPEMHFSGRSGMEGSHGLLTASEPQGTSGSFSLTEGESNLTPNDPYFATAGGWGLQNWYSYGSGYISGFDMDAPRAWDVTTGSSSVIVVVIDNGIQQNHPDLNHWSGHGKDFTPDASFSPLGAPVSANDNHGTAVAGCIAAKINNGIGSVGIAPGVSVASARPHYNATSGGSFSTSSTYIANALNWAREVGAKVTVNSNGYGSSSSAVASAYASAKTAGIAHFAATGNSGASSISYPASDVSVMAVGASAPTGAKASFSQYGTGINFLAPGQGVTTTDRTGSAGYASGDYASVNGTSFATPYAGGVAALLFSNNSSLTPDEIQDALETTAYDMGSSGYDTTNGYGHLDARDAVRATGFKLTVEAGSTTNYLTWTDPILAGMDTSQVAVRFSTTDYPANYSEGSSLSIAMNSSYDHSFLTAGTTYYYTAFGIKSGQVTAFATGSTAAATPNPTNLNSVYWKNSDGRFAIWFNEGATRNHATVASHSAPSGWTSGGRGDFDGDGKEDVLWVHDASGRVIYWRMDGAKRLGYHEFSNAAPSGWYAAGVGDFNLDDVADIVWVHPTQGRVVIWYTDGTNRTSTSQFDAVAPFGWVVGGVGDFNNDSRPDIAWVNQTDLRVAIWYCAGGQRSSASVLTARAPEGWRFAQVGDFNGDDAADILWSHPNGRVVAWLISSGQRASWIELSTAPAGWYIMKR